MKTKRKRLTQLSKLRIWRELLLVVEDRRPADAIEHDAAKAIASELRNHIAALSPTEEA